MRNVSIFVKVSDTNVMMCVSALPGKENPGPYNGSDACWHEVITDVPHDVSDREVLRRLRNVVMWKTYTARFEQLRPGAIIRGEAVA